MFKETLLIVPKLSSSDLASMEKSLSTRFGAVAKKFGKGLTAALSAAGVAGIALGLVDKLLNPLKETQEAIDRILEKGDAVVTDAKEFGTTAGKMLRLQELAKSRGLDEGTLNTLLNKFQNAVADAKADPTKASSVRGFVGQTDMAEAFFNFIQGLQKLDHTNQLLVEQDVFGAKFDLKLSKFLNTDFAKQTAIIGGPSAAALTPKLENLSALNDMKLALESKRDLNDTFQKGGAITAEMIKSQAARAELDLAKENKQIESYQNLANISIASEEIVNTVKDGVLKLAGLAVKVTNLAENVKALLDSRVVRGFLKMIDRK